MPLDDQTKEAFASVIDLTKQLITLGTGVLTLEVSFASGILSRAAIPKLWQLQWAWGLLLISVSAGIWAFMAVTGTLSSEKKLAPSTVFENNIRIPSFVQVFCFALGMASTMWYGLEVLR
ncbi:hypothetical protein HHL24_20665 [Paraburkholderia sp. RP-4-7]|uniref:Uncharacterized protein n=1 Tax=Paraburkholderia polaris TaxID=2728848 RepID=A0A848IDL5_9BURK|nr:hypothetical protein [Paraburkholderia polaris]NMM00342.1 hypothetical protein [Paraburkholderia polaris]